MNQLESVEVLTFDCYGTLIDWESGIRRVVIELAEEHGVVEQIEGILVDWESIQFEMIAGEYRPYREILQASLDETFYRYCVTLRSDEADRLGDEMGHWEPFPDVPEALARLGQRYKLAVLSNVDDDTLAQSVKRMGGDFDELITAEQVRSYKPQTAHFEEALRRFGTPAERFLHCAFGFKYDQRPALDSGMLTAWVKRDGWIRDDDVEPTYEVDTVAELAELLGVS